MEGVYRLNPFYWSRRAIRVFTAGFFLIMLPIYLYIGFQPNISTQALGYPELSIPSITLKTPVEPLQLTERQLIAPSTIAGAYSSNPSKTLIIGHAATVFQNLDQTATGNILTYDSQSYQIVDSQTLEKSDIDMEEILSPAETNTIIIMTCAGEPLPGQDATHRLIVTATAI